VCYMPHLFHPLSYDHHNNIWPRVYIIKLLTVQFSLTFCYFLTLRSSEMWACPLWHVTNILWRVHIIKFLIMQFYAASCYFLPLKSN
jgi:hypothetical protein